MFRQAGSFDAYREAVRGESRGQLADAERLYQLLDGRPPVRRVVDLSRVGNFEGARLLTALRRAGADRARLGVGAAEGRRAPPRERRPAPARLARAPSRAVLPLAALALVAGLAQRAPAPPPAGLAADPLAAARARRRRPAPAQRRRGVTASRTAAGRATSRSWPPTAGRADPAMAGDAASPYSLEGRGAAVAVLAPEY